MLDILESHLNDISTYEIKTLVKNAHEAFDRIGFTNYNTAFEEILLLEGEADTGEVIADIVNLTRKFQKEILGEHGIILIDDAPTDISTDIINALLDIPDYEATSDILKIIEDAGRPEEVFVEILTLVTPHNSDELLLNIESISPFTISKIKEVCTKTTLVLTEEERVLKIKHITGFNKLCTFLHTRPKKVFEMLSTGVDVAYPFIIYANIIGRDLEQLEPEAAAKELIGMAVISIDGYDNIRSVISSNIEKFISNIDQITKIDIIINDILLKFNYE